MDNDTEFLTQANAKIEAKSLFDKYGDPTKLLTIELDDGQQVVVNIQTPMHEIWVASRFGGLHFHQKGGAWRDTRSDKTLDETLVEVLTKLGVEIESV